MYLKGLSTELGRYEADSDYKRENTKHKINEHPSTSHAIATNFKHQKYTPQTTELQSNANENLKLQE